MASETSERDIIDRLIKLGIKERDSRLYYALLRVPKATAAELQHISGVPRTKIYESLDALTQRGLCKSRNSGRARYYQATPPDEVAHQLSDGWRRELDEKQDQAKSVFGDLLDLYQQQGKPGSGLDAIEVIQSKDVIYRRYMGLVDSAQKEILSFVRAPISGDFKPGVRHDQDKVEDAACDRGVIRRSVYRYEPDNLDWMRHNLTQSLSTSNEFRIVHELPIKMFVFDGCTSLIALPSIPGLSGTDFTMIVIQDVGMADACRLLFETKWQQGKTLEEWECEEIPINLKA